MIFLHDLDVIYKGRSVLEIPHSGGDHSGHHLFFKDAMAFPGLINSHDHLEFNSFPQLGNGVYKNYMEWGSDIHEKNKTEIDKVLNIPPDLRVRWGAYKNLLCGVTTVIHHGEKINTTDLPVSVFNDFHFLHSVGLQKNWKRKLNRPFKSHKPFVIHIGEGVDEAAEKEIKRFVRWNVFKRKTVAVHGVAMKEEQAAFFEALVWCPVSNFFLLNQTAAIDKLKLKTKILFGTDSTLSAGWNLWEHLRMARNTGLATDEEILNMLTVNALDMWKISNSDVVVVKRKAKNDFESFFNTNPEDILLVIGDNQIKLFDDSLSEQFQKQNFDFSPFSKISIQGKIKFVIGDLPQLAREIRRFYSGAEFPFEIS